MVWVGAHRLMVDRVLANPKVGTLKKLTVWRKSTENDSFSGNCYIDDPFLAHLTNLPILHGGANVSA